MIFQAAECLIVERGIERFSMRELAARLGWTATTLYRYVVDRRALLRGAADRVVTRLTRQLRQAPPFPLDTELAVTHIAEATIRFAAADPQLFAFLRWLSTNDPEWVDRSEPVMSYVAIVHHALGPLVSSQSGPTTVHAVAHTVVSLIYGLAAGVRWHPEFEQGPAPALVGKMAAILVREEPA